MRPINWIVIHCSATPNGKEFHASDIDKWHKEKGWAGIGYHYVIPIDGRLELGRPVEQVGAHVQGHNSDSIGICMIGTDDFTGFQWETLKSWVLELKKLFPAAAVCGHRDFEGVHKTCPGFDVKTWLKEEGI